MYVRSTTFRGDPNRIDDVVGFVRDRVAPMISGLPGNLGLIVSADRSTGRCVASSLWESLETMRASDQALAPIRAEAGEILGTTPEPQEFEVAELHRVRPVQAGFAQRATQIDFDPSDADALIETYRSTTIPAASMLRGFTAATLLIDRTAGRAVSVVGYDSREALEASRDQAAEIRRVSVEKAHARVVEVVELDVLYADVRLPEPMP